jgi:cytochrome c553
MAELWEDPDHCKRMSDLKKGENNPLWNNGSSDRGYCYKFIEVQPRVRAFFNDTCVDCGKTKAEEGREMSVHHVYSNKNVCCDEDERKVLVTVCASCHGKIPKYRLNMTPEHLKKIKLWEEKYLNLIANKYGGKCYYTVEEMEMIFETLENEQI